MGRAARHVDGHVVMYADKTTGSMKRAILETERRRKIQAEYNLSHGVKPRSISKAVVEDRLAGAKKEEPPTPAVRADLKPTERRDLIKLFTEKMEMAAKNLEFEEAAELRDQIQALRQSKD